MNEGLNSDDDGDSAASIDTEELLDRASILSGSPGRRENNPIFRRCGSSRRSPRSRSASSRRHRPPKPWDRSVGTPQWPLPPGPIGTTAGGDKRMREKAAAPHGSPIVLRKDGDEQRLFLAASHARCPSTPPSRPSPSPHGRSSAALQEATSMQAAGTHAGAYSALQFTPIAFDKRPNGPRRYAASSPLSGSGGRDDLRLSVGALSSLSSLSLSSSSAAAAPSGPVAGCPRTGAAGVGGGGGGGAAAAAAAAAAATSRLDPAEVRRFVSPHTPPNFFNERLEPELDPQRWWELLQLRRAGGDETVYYDPEHALPATVAAAFDAACLKGDIAGVQRHYCLAAFARAVDSTTATARSGWNHMHRAAQDNNAKLLSVRAVLCRHPACVRLHVCARACARACVRAVVRVCVRAAVRACVNSLSKFTGVFRYCWSWVPPPMCATARGAPRCTWRWAQELLRRCEC
jgi:hypothetical protein